MTCTFKSPCGRCQTCRMAAEIDWYVALTDEQRAAFLRGEAERARRDGVIP